MALSTIDVPDFYGSLTEAQDANTAVIDINESTGPREIQTA